MSVVGELFKGITSVFSVDWVAEDDNKLSVVCHTERIKHCCVYQHCKNCLYRNNWYPRENVHSKVTTHTELGMITRS